MSELNLILFTLLGVLIGGVGTFAVYNSNLKKKGMTAEDIQENAKLQIEKIKKEKLIHFREEMQQKRAKFNEEFKSKEILISKERSPVNQQREGTAPARK